MSHTVKIRVEVKNKTALAEAVVEQKGTVLGEGTHRLYQASEQGFGFTLPAWTYPIVLKTSGEMAYDDYNGSWGNVVDIAALLEKYALKVVKIAADAQGWMSEPMGNSLVIYHPSGGTLTVGAGGVVDAQNFLGSSCTGATEAIEAALGTRQEQSLKSEFFAERAHIVTRE